MGIQSLWLISTCSTEHLQVIVNIVFYICLGASCNVAKLMMVMIMGFIVRHVFNAILCVAVQRCGVTTLLQRPPNLIC